MNLSTVKWAQWDKTQSRELSVCSYVCASHCAQLLHTILHRTDLIVFHLTLQTITTAPMMSIWGKGDLHDVRWTSPVNRGSRGMSLIHRCWCDVSNNRATAVSAVTANLSVCHQVVPATELVWVPPQITLTTELHIHTHTHTHTHAHTHTRTVTYRIFSL